MTTAKILHSMLYNVGYHTN